MMSMVAKLWPFRYIKDDRQPPSWIFEIQKMAGIMYLSCIQPELCYFKYLKQESSAKLTNQRVSYAFTSSP